jgi:hypothetical protein
VRRDPRVGEILIGAPAGQPEVAGWSGIPFLSYLPETLNPRGMRVRDRLGGAPSFVAFEGYDTIVALADLLRGAGSWSRVAVEGTRGEIRFTRVPGINVWQWAWPPVQVAVS